MLIYLMVALVFGVTAGLAAHSKGRSSLGWFLCGLIIGPFAFIVAALPRVEREGRFLRCGTCGEVVRADATVCRYCRTELKLEEEAPPFGEGRLEPDSWR